MTKIKCPECRTEIIAPDPIGDTFNVRICLICYHTFRIEKVTQMVVCVSKSPNQTVVKQFLG